MGLCMILRDGVGTVPYEVGIDFVWFCGCLFFIRHLKQLCSVGNAKLFKNMRCVGFHRVFGNTHFFGNDFALFVFQYVTEHLPFPIG